MIDQTDVQRWISGHVPDPRNKTAIISIVAYEHPAGIPARFCAGLIPAVVLAKKITKQGGRAWIRVIDPTPIANFCNAWHVPTPRFRDVVSDFLNRHDVSFFFDTAQYVTDESVTVLKELGVTLTEAHDASLSEIVRRIIASGKKHGGDQGKNAALLYMAAHPFSWLDMHHPLIWRRRYDAERYSCINLMSKAESRFTAVRGFLKTRRPDLVVETDLADCYMTVCNTPCYIPLDGEPLISDYDTRGSAWCHEAYMALKHVSENHRRALRDFEARRGFEMVTA